MNCTNPKCKATGIPDEAKFCPVCGTPIIVGDSPWKKKREELDKKFQRLRTKKDALLEFQQVRNSMYETLNKDGKFRSAMDELRKNIKQTKEDELIERKKTFSRRRWGWGLSLLSFSSLCIIGALMSYDYITLPSYALVGIWIVGIFLVFFGIKIASYNSPDSAHTQDNNHYIISYIQPFVDSNKAQYNIIGRDLNDEIFNTQDVSTDISAQIASLNNQIEELEAQKQMLITLQNG